MEEINLQEIFKLAFAGGRLETFKNWGFDKKKNPICSSVNLAKAGFIMSHEHKCTLCPFTGKSLEWEDETEDPFSEHRAHCRGCEFVAVMDKEESEWTIEDTFPLLAALATQARLKQLNNWKEECERSYSKIEGRLTPYIPKNSVADDEEE